MIQPYELLGATIHSSIKDVRKAYYNLALICHPDKGGSVEEMQMVQAAYEWILDQLLAVEHHNKTGKTFEEYLAEQKENMARKELPQFDDIILQANDIQAATQFRQYAPIEWHASKDKFLWFKRFLFLYLHSHTADSIPYEQIIAEMQHHYNNIEAMTIPHGYGSEMKEVPPIMFPPKTVIKLEEDKLATNVHSQPGAMILPPKELGDYTKRIGNLCMSDYRHALSPQDPSTLEDAMKDICSDYFTTAPIDRKLEELKITRQIQDQSLSE